jgi:hypothetical protein
MSAADDVIVEVIGRTISTRAIQTEKSIIPVPEIISDIIWS